MLIGDSEQLWLKLLKPNLMKSDGDTDITKSVSWSSIIFIKFLHVVLQWNGISHTVHLSYKPTKLGLPMPYPIG